MVVKKVAFLRIVALAVTLAGTALQPVRAEDSATPHGGDGGICARSEFRVLIDVGHTATSPGADSARGVPEYDFNLKLADVIAQSLHEAGFDKTVRLITSGAKFASLFERARRANNVQADLFISIHHDSVPDNLKEVWQYEGKKSYYSDRFSGYAIFVSNDNADRAGSLAFGHSLGQELQKRGLHYTPHYALPLMGRYRHELDDRFHETDHGTGNLLADSSFVVDRTRSGIMAGWRQAVALAMTGEEIEALTALSRSRTEPAGRVSRAAMLLGYREKPSFFAVGRRLGVHHQTVQRCVERAMAYGALAALDDRPRPGKEPTITPEAKAWLVSLACDKAKEHGYPHELWTTRLLARHARERGPAAGHQCLARLAQGTVCKLLGQEEIKPHKVRYYLERRDAEFEPKMAEVLCVYREVQVLKKAAAKAEKSKKPVAIVSYDEKPGIQAIATTAPDLPPVPGRHASFARDHEYKRHGTLSLLAGIDLLTGKVHALVRERHRSREFIEFLKLLDAAYPASTAIKLILDNHSAHISRETRAWLDTRPPGRFDFTFTPKHGSWLNLIEGFFSKFARSVLRHIRVTSKQELKDRIMAAIDDVNRHPVVHTWSYKLAEAA